MSEFKPPPMRWLSDGERAESELEYARDELLDAIEAHVRVFSRPMWPDWMKHAEWVGYATKNYEDGREMKRALIRLLQQHGRPVPEEALELLGEDDDAGED